MSFQGLLEAIQYRAIRIDRTNTNKVHCKDYKTAMSYGVAVEIIVHIHVIIFPFQSVFASLNFLIEHFVRKTGQRAGGWRVSVGPQTADWSIVVVCNSALNF